MALLRSASIVIVMLLGASASHAQGVMPLAAMDSSIGHVDVTLDLPKDVPYVGEMILLRVRSTIRGFVALDEMRQPPLTNFNWQQLGRDKPIRVMVDGFDVPGFERDIAIFPQQAGRLIIEPFIRHVTMVVGENQRVEIDFASKPIYVDVQRHEGIGHADDWWLPAKSVTAKETWSPPPDEIAPGQVARRTVTIEAVGTTADRLPPPPNMRASGLITFTGPASRETILTAEGPIARATYQWDVRPVSNSPAKLPAIHIVWFDITERRLRDTAVADHWVSYIGAETVDKRDAGGSFGGKLLSSGVLAMGAAGFLWAASFGALVVLSKPGWRIWSSNGGVPLKELAKAARQRNAQGVKAALMALARADPARWAMVRDAPTVATDLARLDASLYGGAASEGPDLKGLASAISRQWQVLLADQQDELVCLPLDGAPVVRRQTLVDRTIATCRNLFRR